MQSVYSHTTLVISSKLVAGILSAHVSSEGESMHELVHCVTANHFLLPSLLPNGNMISAVSFSAHRFIFVEGGSFIR